LRGAATETRGAPDSYREEEEEEEETFDLSKMAWNPENTPRKKGGGIIE
jgi:hypothetical protein